MEVHYKQYQCFQSCRLREERLGDDSGSENLLFPEMIPVVSPNNSTRCNISEPKPYSVGPKYGGKAERRFLEEASVALKIDVRRLDVGRWNRPRPLTQPC